MKKATIYTGSQPGTWTLVIKDTIREKTETFRDLPSIMDAERIIEQSGIFERNIKMMLHPV